MLILLGLTAFVVGVVGFFYILIYIGKVCVFVNVIFFFVYTKSAKYPTTPTTPTTLIL